MVALQTEVVDSRGEHELDGLLRLVASVFELGIQDAVLPQGRTPVGSDRSNAERVRRRALHWVLSDQIEPWTFRWCCDLLGIEEGGVELLRRRVARDPARLYEEMANYRVHRAPTAD